MTTEESSRRIAPLLTAIVLALVTGVALIAWLWPGGEASLPGTSPAQTVPEISLLVGDAPDDRPPVTFNEFLPEERGLGECISAVPKPGCGSKARGGWRQGLVLLVILGGLAFIAWRVVRSARTARLDESNNS